MNNRLRAFLWTAGTAAVGYVVGRLIGNTEREKELYAKRGRWICGATGLGISLFTMPKKDTVNYTHFHI